MKKYFDDIDISKSPWKKDFPFLINNDCVYLDSASTSIIPKIVIDKVNEYLNNYPVNSDRGNNFYSRKVDKEISSSREKIASFISANSSEILFTSGATNSSNFLALSYGLFNLKDGDEILLCRNEHKSTIKPFENLLEIYNKKINIKYFDIDNEGDYKEEEIFSNITDKTKILVLTHIHNKYGLEMNIKYIIENVRKLNKNIKIVLDMSQSIGHIPISVKELDIDFGFFSGHKMFAMKGIGVLYIKKENLKYMVNIFQGGENNLQKNVDKAEMLESGTKNIPAIISLGEAVNYIQRIGIDNIQKYIYSLILNLYEQLKQIEQISFSNGIERTKCAFGTGILLFKVNGIKTEEILQIFDEYNIIVRGNTFCSREKEDDEYIRISLNIYNDYEDILKVFKVLKYILNNR